MPIRGPFCVPIDMTVAFFAAWAMIRQQPDPLLHFGGMVMVASIACAVVAIFGRAIVADQRLNRWDEAFAYLAIALSVELWETLYTFTTYRAAAPWMLPALGAPLRWADYLLDT
jgi:hypothetical protein